MRRLLLGIACVVCGLVAACGGSPGSAPPARTITIPGSPLPADPGTNPPPPPPSTLNSQLWESSGPSTQPMFRVAVLDDLGFLGWWKQERAEGPPLYGVVLGGLQQATNPERFETPDMVAMHVPDNNTEITPFSVPMPLSAETAVQFGAISTTMHAVPQAHEALGMEQRSGRYAGELQLPGHREPVSLQWDAGGTLSLSFTNLPPNACGATGQASPLAGAPNRLLAVQLVFSGTACPAVGSNTPLNGIVVNGAIDASSADAFVLFGVDTIRLAPLVLPATRVSPPSLLGAWTGFNANAQEFHLAIAERGIPRKSVQGWTRSLATNPPSYGVLMGATAALDASSTDFRDENLLHMNTVDGVYGYVGFAGPLPASDSMNVQFASAAATMQAAPIAQLALPTQQRVGRYGGDLHAPGLLEPAVLDWAANGQLTLLLNNWGNCSATGTTSAMAGGPQRWLNFALSFQGAQCPSSSTGVNLAGQTVRGSIDAASGDAFVLFGVNDTPMFQLPLVLPATRLP